MVFKAQKKAALSGYLHTSSTLVGSSVGLNTSKPSGKCAHVESSVDFASDQTQLSKLARSSHNARMVKLKTRCKKIVLQMEQDCEHDQYTAEE
jgi:hypothetical protein